MIYFYFFLKYCLNLLKNDIDITYNEFNYIKDQPGNYRETLREHDDALDELGWKPKDRLKDYIMSL